MTKFECKDCQYKNACNKILVAKDDNNPICNGVIEHIDDMENEHRKDAKYQIYLWLTALLLTYAVAYGVGYAKGCKRVLETAQGWQEMYDRHINQQWNIIQKRDSLYMKYIDLKLQ